MKRFLVYLFAIAGVFRSAEVSAQKKLIQKLDTTTQINPYVDSIPLASAVCSGEEEMSAISFDADLLNCLIMKKVNDYRIKVHLHTLEYSRGLEKIAFNYIKLLGSYSFYNNWANHNRIKKSLRKVSRVLKYNKALIKVVMDQVTAIDVLRGKEYFYYSKGDTEINLYYLNGKEPTHKEIEDGLFQLDPVKFYTYEKLAEYYFKTVVLRHYSRVIRDKGLRQIACRCAFVSNTLKWGREPRMNILLLTGASRFELIPEKK